MTATTTTPATAKVGDVFSRSWGYDQTNVDFYEIVSVSKTGKTGKARKVKNVVSANGQGSDSVVPATGPDRFVTGDRARCSRCSNYHVGRDGWDGHAFSDEYGWSAKYDHVTVDRGEHAWRWDGKPRHQTAWGYGH